MSAIRTDQTKMHIQNHAILQKPQVTANEKTSHWPSRQNLEFLQTSNGRFTVALADMVRLFDSQEVFG